MSGLENQRANFVCLYNKQDLKPGVYVRMYVYMYVFVTIQYFISF